MQHSKPSVVYSSCLMRAPLVQRKLCPPFPATLENSPPSPFSLFTLGSSFMSQLRSHSLQEVFHNSPSLCILMAFMTLCL